VEEKDLKTMKNTRFVIVSPIGNLGKSFDLSEAEQTDKPMK